MPGAGRPRRAPRAVHVVGGARRRVVLHDVAHVSDVEAAGRHVLQGGGRGTGWERDSEAVRHHGNRRGHDVTIRPSWHGQQGHRQPR